MTFLPAATPLGDSGLRRGLAGQLVDELLGQRAVLGVVQLLADAASRPSAWPGPPPCPCTSAMALSFSSWICRRGLGLELLGLLARSWPSAPRGTSPSSAWFLRIISAASRRASAMAVFCSASSFSASARSRLADSMALVICFSRSSTRSRMGPHAFRRSTMATMMKVTSVQKMRPGRTSVKLEASEEQGSAWGSSQVLERRRQVRQEQPGPRSAKHPRRRVERGALARSWSARRMQMTSANSVAPSMSAAAMIIVVRMSPPADG